LNKTIRGEGKRMPQGRRHHHSILPVKMNSAFTLKVLLSKVCKEV
jgi:hypothetical protein